MAGVWSLDCETTGLDIRHGVRPFFVTACSESGDQLFWEWDVDPLTRDVIVPPGDIEEVADFIREAERLVLHNAKFDATALCHLHDDLRLAWDWGKVWDTLIASHVLGSSQPHDLTSLVLQWLGVDLEPLETKLRDITVQARGVARRHLPAWLLAKKDGEGMPSAKDKTWKADLWLPRQLADELGYEDGHPYRTVTRDYANGDSAGTLPLYKLQERELDRRKLRAIYDDKMKLPRIAFLMEEHGVTLSASRLEEQAAEYAAESGQMREVCETIAAEFHADCHHCGGLGYRERTWRVRGKEKTEQKTCAMCSGSPHGPYRLTLPKSGNNLSLTHFAFNILKLPVVGRTESGAPSLDAGALETYQVTLPDPSRELDFVTNLAGKRKRDTGISYLAGYRRFWLPYSGQDDHEGPHDGEWHVLHPSLNITGTATTRWSCSNPNEQNISKKKGFNLRRPFGPAPGREWWAIDAQNIELRLPAYFSGERAMIDLFERPDEAPYYGSNHLLVAHVLHPKMFEECIGEDGRLDGRIFKKRYDATWYKWVKNGNFAVQYGAQESSGTADRAYHVPGAQRIIGQRFTKIKELNDRMVDMANRLGYIETAPRRSVDPARGYPLMCQRTEWGRVKPTVPLSYFIQGTAGEWMGGAMIRCQAQLDEWRREDGFDGHIIMQVHDELDFDFPKVGDPRRDPRRSNLWRVHALQELMEMSGDDIGVPTPTSAEYHPESWAEGYAITS